jgi:AAT family amino acid transporter
MDMAPSFLKRLNKNGMPQRSVILSVCACWLVILLYSFNPDSAIYTYLLAVSGFTGAMAWISICWSQYRFRRHLQLTGEDKALRYKTPLFPYVTLFGIWAQVFCLVVIAFTPDLRQTLYAGVPMMVVPMLWYRLREHYRHAHAPQPAMVRGPKS